MPDISLAVSLIVPNWNGADLLKAYLPTLEAAQARFAGQSELIVVDDASTDDSVAMLEKNFPRVRLVRHEKNRGFGKACNSGAMAAQYAYLILLNSDVAVAPDFIDPLLKRFEDPAVFAASPLILDESGQIGDVTISTPYFRRGKIRFKPAHLNLLRSGDSRRLPAPWYTLFPLGGAFAAHRQRFLDMGGFDDLFEPFYYEDTDLGFRAWRRGWTCVVVPESQVTHFHTGTIARSFKHLRLNLTAKRNRLLFLWKNLTTPALLRRQLGFQLLRFCYAPFCLEYRGWLATLLALPKFPAARRRRIEERKAVVRDENEIFALIAAANAANRRYIAAETAERQA